MAALRHRSDKSTAQYVSGAITQAHIAEHRDTALAARS